MRRVRRAALRRGSALIFTPACYVCYVNSCAQAEYGCAGQRQAAANSTQRNVLRRLARLVFVVDWQRYNYESDRFDWRYASHRVGERMPRLAVSTENAFFRG